MVVGFTQMRRAESASACTRDCSSVAPLLSAQRQEGPLAFGLTSVRKEPLVTNGFRIGGLEISHRGFRDSAGRLQGGSWPFLGSSLGGRLDLLRWLPG